LPAGKISLDLLAIRRLRAPAGGPKQTMGAALKHVRTVPEDGKFALHRSGRLSGSPSDKKPQTAAKWEECYRSLLDRERERTLRSVTVGRFGEVLPSFRDDEVGTVPGYDSAAAPKVSRSAWLSKDGFGHCGTPQLRGITFTAQRMKHDKPLYV
jgi:hypothetical protein